MPQINLSSLSGPELRQRLDSSRARGDAALAYEILREMEARRAEAGRRRADRKRRAGEPRIVDVDLSDPLDKGDELPPMPHWRAPDLVAAEAAAAEAEAARPAPTQDPPRFRTLDAPLALVEPEPPPTPRPPEHEPEPLAFEPPPPAERRRDRARSGHGLRIAAGFAVGITSGVALGWFAGDLVRATPAAAAPPQAALQVAAQAVTPPPVVETPELPPEPPAPDMTIVAEAPAAAEAAVPAASVEPERPVFAPADAPAPAADACAAEATPADREICADPDLQRLQRDLRRAYAEALDAHDDRALLRQRQLAWRDARSGVSDPARLARLYEQRIRRLDAAAAQARALRQAGDES